VEDGIKMPADEISLPQAALLIGRPYAETRDLALRGVLRARQVAGRFWLVDRDSALRFLATVGSGEPAG
jgi:hypothetical protein